MIGSLKTAWDRLSHYEDIINYIYERFNEAKNLISDNDLAIQHLQQVQNDILAIIATINDKITEDTLDTINDLGNYDEFVQGFNDGFGG